MSSFRLRRNVAAALMLSDLGILVCYVVMGVNWMETEYSFLEYSRDGMLLGLWLLVIIGQFVISGAITTPPASPCFPKRLRRKYEAVNNIFWASVCDEFPELSGKAAYGIRTGFKVVSLAEEEPAISARIMVMNSSVELPLMELLRSMSSQHR